MEPERPIEKLLRDYAKKRRDEAGAPLEMHPISRRLLQDEVARTIAAPEIRKSSLSQFLARYWPRFAVAGATLIAAVLVVALWLPSSSRHQAGMELAQNKLEAPLQPRNEPVPLAAAAPETKPLEIAKNKEATDLAAAAAPSPAREQLGVDKAARQPEDRERALFIRRYGLAAPPKTQESAALAQTPNPSLDSKVADAGVLPTLTNQPASVVVANSSSMRALAAPSAAATDSLIKDKIALPVLAAFNIESSGSELRIIDVDGSIYAGSIQVVDAALRGRVALADSPSVSSSLKRADRQLAPDGAAAPAPTRQTLAQNYSFRVTGTNLSLNQPVVFTGQLLGPTNLLSWVQTTQSLAASFGEAVGGTRKTLAQAALPMPSGPMILGKATIGTNQELKVQAVPAKP